MLFLTHSGEADSNRCGLADMLEHLGLAVLTDVMSNLKVAKRSCIMGEYDNFLFWVIFATGKISGLNRYSLLRQVKFHANSICSFSVQSL